MPKTRRSFWKKKFEKNLARDERVMRELRVLGWRVETIWECETFSAEVLRAVIEGILGERE